MLLRLCAKHDCLLVAMSVRTRRKQLNVWMLHELANWPAFDLLPKSSALSPVCACSDCLYLRDYMQTRS